MQSKQDSNRIVTGQSCSRMVVMRGATNELLKAPALNASAEPSMAIIATLVYIMTLPAGNESRGGRAQRRRTAEQLPPAVSR